MRRNSGWVNPQSTNQYPCETASIALEEKPPTHPPPDRQTAHLVGGSVELSLEVPV